MKNNKKKTAGFILSFVAFAMVIVSFYFGIIAFAQKGALRTTYSVLGYVAVGIGVACGITVIVLTKKGIPSVPIIGLNGVQAFVLCASLAIFDPSNNTEFVSLIQNTDITELNMRRIEVRSFEGEYQKSKIGYDNDLFFFNMLNELEFTGITYDTGESKIEDQKATIIYYLDNTNAQQTINFYDCGVACFENSPFARPGRLYYTFDEEQYNDLFSAASKIVNEYPVDYFSDIDGSMTKELTEKQK